MGVPKIKEVVAAMRSKQVHGLKIVLHLNNCSAMQA